MAILNSSASRKMNRAGKAFRIWFVMLALLFWSGWNLGAQTISKEYQLKAVFLFNFAQFVTWPSDAFPETQAPLTIGILGDDPFDDYLDNTVHDEKADEHPLIVQRYHHVADIKNCQILFISRSESKRIGQILADLKGRNILTVGDIDGFTRDGGVVRFVTEQNKIRFRVNLEAAKMANLTISSKLLKLAEIVEPGTD